MSVAPSLSVAVESFPLATPFTISRGSRTSAEVVVATVAAGGFIGRGECVPYKRYGETVEGVVAAIAELAAEIAEGLDREALSRRLPAGAARNALDCALWDLEAKTTGRPVHQLAGLPAPSSAVTCYTLSLGSPDAMAEAAHAARHRPILKVKLGGAGDPERIRAVRHAAPDAILVVDANEAWDEGNLAAHIAACRDADVRWIEQPLPAGADGGLAGIAHPIPICADESLHTTDDLPALRGRYDAINIKLDKTGGLTEALRLMTAAKAQKFGVMLGCMVGTSLAMAPAMLLAAEADFVDLDGPLLLARDRDPGLRYEGSLVLPPLPALWG